MANNPGHASADDFFGQILPFPSYAGPQSNLAGNDLLSSPAAAPMMLQLNSAYASGHLGSGGFQFPLGLSSDQGNGVLFNVDDASGRGKRFCDDDVVDNRISSSVSTGFHAQSMHNPVPAMPQPPAIRPRVRARRGQATDPHSIAERLRRERISERIRALQELVPSVNKTDRATMLDEILDYVKFLRLQVKVLSMSRLGGAGAVAPLVTEIPVSSIEDECDEDGRNQPWHKLSNDGTEQEVVRLMDKNVGAAMQFLQSRGLCIMPISLASAIYQTRPSDTTILTKPGSDHCS